ncbi:hypothetical protein O181_089507 [Austropuccinia psidii MF-1]|uniref:Uncharacterized protein n=1 Tax=Austropuccinia psidii MF-1 TaxID=1389203 RepID=A0A9Q3ITK7_9BASI|nr:hypothetical protein [Austropuccinia psidii MF-1]
MSPLQLAIIGRNMSNLNKHCGQCCGCFNAWSSKAPGVVDPNMDAKLAEEEQESMLKQLVKGLVEIQVSFSIFESPQLGNVLQRLAPNFHWPKCQLVAQTALQLYFKQKDQLLQEVDDLPLDTLLCGAIDCWTTKDQSESYLAIFLKWINPVNYNFCKSIVALEFAGINITCDQEQRFHQCACHVLNLVAKDFLLYMGQLTNEDYNIFDDCLGVTKNSIEDSNNDVGLEDNQGKH